MSLLCWSRWGDARNTGVLQPKLSKGRIVPQTEGPWPLFCRIPHHRTPDSTFPSNQQTHSTYLFLLLIEVVDDDANEQVQGEKGAEDNEDNKIYVHVNVVLILGLLFLLNGR